MAAAVASRGSPSPAFSEPVSVHEDAWIREEAADGRIYFFNKATGASQWHIPNEFYHSKCLGKDKKMLREDFVEKMPGSARAVLGVDCVMQVHGTGVPAEVQAVRDNLMAALSPERRRSSIKPQNRVPIMPQPILKMEVVSASGLRDADFMPGRDKSDPYVVCEIVGKEEESRFQTAVVMDDLDPVWHHVELMPDYTPGDILSFTVWDEDESGQTTAATAILCRDGESSLYKSASEDDCLGKLLLTEEDVEMAMRAQGASFLLDDEFSPPGVEAYLTVRTAELMGWPSFKGQPAPDVQDDIEQACPGKQIVMLEKADQGSEVVSWEMVHVRNGYTGNFVGVYAEAASKLRKGDTIQLGDTRYTVARIHGQGSSKKPPVRQMTYLYFEEDIDGFVKNGMPWKKVTRVAGEGFNPDRVCVYYDVVTMKVLEIPCIG